MYFTVYYRKAKTTFGDVWDLWEESQMMVDAPQVVIPSMVGTVTVGGWSSGDGGGDKVGGWGWIIRPSSLPAPISSAPALLNSPYNSKQSAKYCTLVGRYRWFWTHLCSCQLSELSNRQISKLWFSSTVDWEYPVCQGYFAASPWLRSAESHSIELNPRFWGKNILSRHATTPCNACSS